MTDYYQILGVNRNSSQDDIKKAYRKLAAKHHPDRGGDTASFQKIQEAYDVLGNDQKRQQYDNPMPEMRQFHFHSGPGGFDDIFSQFNFGGMRRQPQKNRHINITVQMSLEEVLTGKSVVGNIQLPSGRDQYIELQIPAGVKNGDNIRFGGLGDDSIPGLPRGDLVAVIRELPHERFVRNGADIITTVKTNILDIIVGGTIKVETLDKKILEVTVPQNFSVDGNLCCGGHGLPAVNSARRGNLYINLSLSNPKLSPEDVEVLKAIKKKYST
jgi:DnaJ-class molecular chaperone